MSAIATRPRAPAPLPDDVQALERSLQLESTSTSGREHVEPQSQPRAAASKRTLDQEEVFHSTAEHRAWVFGATALFSATLARGLSDIHDVPTALGAAAAALLAYYVSGARSCAGAPLLFAITPSTCESPHAHAGSLCGAAALMHEWCKIFACSMCCMRDG